MLLIFMLMLVVSSIVVLHLPVGDVVFDDGDIMLCSSY